MGTLILLLNKMTFLYTISNITGTNGKWALTVKRVN